MAIARLNGGPLAGQVIPLDPTVGEQLIVPYGEGQIIYRRVGALTNTGPSDGPTAATFEYAGSTEDIAPTSD
ncbi:MAG TPA: response regulator [Microbacteriaceae bacterium]|jgi:hypothetical protein|nr:response regulator [Microbacteriaceae bacterium]HQX35436.1 response regulator [Microbacteriaceae bacterium]HQZ47528.1 response regulator [Microbacteriaceae bacterium]HRA09150.1 response regulator [Microbacteriaceae bacterium]